MVNTIHDLAVAYGKEHQGTVDIEVFEAGANAVLNIIVDIVEHRNFTAFPKATHNELINKIKELKGE